MDLYDEIVAVFLGSSPSDLVIELFTCFSDKFSPKSLIIVHLKPLVQGKRSDSDGTEA